MQVEPTTALEWVIACSVKVKGLDRSEFKVLDTETSGTKVHHVDHGFFDPLTNDADAWAVMAELIKAKGFQLWYALEIPNVSIARKASFLSYQELPACLRADGIDPLKALLVYAAVRWL